MGRTLARLSAFAAALLIAAADPPRALAGAQRYEPLSAAVQARLQRSVSDEATANVAFADPIEGEVWLKTLSPRLAKRIPDPQARHEFLLTVHYEASRAGLDPHLVLGLIQVESNFRKYAVSSAGARGYMQVMPFWVTSIGHPDHNLFHLRTSLRYGCTILRHYLDIEKGDLGRALERYNGSLGRGTGYAGKVLQAWRTRWMLEPENPPARTRPVAESAMPARIADRPASKPRPMVFMGSPH